MRGGIKPLDGTFALSRNWEYFHARWQTNAILFRRLSGPDDVTNFTVASQLVSWSGHQHALVGPPALLTTWDDRKPSVPHRPISFLYTSHCELDPLRDVLNLGIMYAEIGSVRWDGNRFGTECIVHRDRVLISGELFPEPDGPPRALTVHYAFPHSALHYVIRYGYHCNAPPAIPPTVITSFWITRDPKGAQIEMELNQWRILDFQTAATPMAAEAFDAAPFAQSNRWTALVYTNGGFYERTDKTAPSGWPMCCPLPASRPSPPRQRRAGPFTPAGAASTSRFSPSCWGRRKQNHKQPQLSQRTIRYEIQIQPPNSPAGGRPARRQLRKRLLLRNDPFGRLRPR